MTLEELKSALPDTAKDLRLNLGNVLTSEVLTPVQVWGSALVAALAARHRPTIASLAAEAREHLSPEQISAVHTASALMAMNNVYYRFTHLVDEPEYERLPARLRMQGLASHGADPLDFELWCLSASIVNGCGRCIASHERAVVEKGARREAVRDVARIAAVVHGVAATLDGVEASADAAF